MTSTGQPWTQLTLSVGDTPASHSATPAHETAQTIPDTYGQCSPEPFAIYDPNTHCWRTLQLTCLSDSDKFSAIWPRSGMTRNGTAFQRQPSAPRTSAIAYSLSLHGNMEWTPTAKANQMAPSMQLRNPGLRLLPTPDASPHKYRLQGSTQQSKSLSALAGGKLKAEWVEGVMGFPKGWSGLEDSEAQ